MGGHKRPRTLSQPAAPACTHACACTRTRTPQSGPNTGHRVHPNLPHKTPWAPSVGGTLCHDEAPFPFSARLGSVPSPHRRPRPCLFSRCALLSAHLGFWGQSMPTPGSLLPRLPLLSAWQSARQLPSAWLEAAPLPVGLPASVSVLSVAGERMRAWLPSGALPAPRCSAPWVLPPPLAGRLPILRSPGSAITGRGRTPQLPCPPARPVPGPTWVQGGDSAGLRRLLPVVGVKISPAAALDEHPPGLLGVHPFSSHSREAPGCATGRTWPSGPAPPGAVSLWLTFASVSVPLGGEGANFLQPPGLHQLVPKPTAPIDAVERTPACVRAGLCCWDGAWWSSSDASHRGHAAAAETGRGPGCTCFQAAGWAPARTSGARPVWLAAGACLSHGSQAAGPEWSASTPGPWVAAGHRLCPASSRGHTLCTVAVWALAFPYVC